MTTFVPEDRVGWWGGPDTRLRCRRCGKVVFHSIQRAQHSVDRAVVPMHVYRCQSGYWHLTRTRK